MKQKELVCYGCGAYQEFATSPEWWHVNTGPNEHQAICPACYAVMDAASRDALERLHRENRSDPETPVSIEAPEPEAIPDATPEQLADQNHAAGPWRDDMDAAPPNMLPLLVWDGDLMHAGYYAGDEWRRTDDHETIEPALLWADPMPPEVTHDPQK